MYLDSLGGCGWWGGGGGGCGGGFFFFQAEDGIRDHCVTGVQTCALPILLFLQTISRCGSAPAFYTAHFSLQQRPLFLSCPFFVAAAPPLLILPISRCGSGPLFILPGSRCGSPPPFFSAHFSLRQHPPFFFSPSPLLAQPFFSFSPLPFATPSPLIPFSVLLCRCSINPTITAVALMECLLVSLQFGTRYVSFITITDITFKRFLKQIFITGLQVIHTY